MGPDLCVIFAEMNNTINVRDGKGDMGKNNVCIFIFHTTGVSSAWSNYLYVSQNKFNTARVNDSLCVDFVESVQTEYLTKIG